MHDLHLDYEEQHDRSRLPQLRNKHNDHRRERRLHDVKVEQYDGTESLQTYEDE
jgi:hypothetical protein